MKQLNGKSVLITGATGETGAAMARLLAAQGCKLGLLDVTQARLDALAERLRQSDAVVAARETDLRDRQSVHDAIAAVQEDTGPIDVLIHAANIGEMTAPDRQQLDRLDGMLEVNYLAAAYAVEAVLPSMLKRGSGRIVGLSSLAALRGWPWVAGYSATTAAMATLLESLRPPLRQRGVAVTVGYLGFVRTAAFEATTFRRRPSAVSPEAAAAKILTAAARRRREVYFPWHHACAARVLQRLPVGLFDWLMPRVAGRWIEDQY